MTPGQRIAAHAPLLTSVALSTAWSLLALRHPTRTYHLAPLAVAVAWPLVARSRGRARSIVAAARASFGGVGVALLTTLELHANDALRGPALVGGTATTEAVILAAVGCLWGFRVATRARIGIVGALLLPSRGKHRSPQVGSTG